MVRQELTQHGAVGQRHDERGKVGKEEKVPVDATVVSLLIGARLKQARRGRFTIEELAKASGVSAGRISQLERGSGNPSFETLWKLARALDEPLGAFFDGVDTNPGRMLVRRKEAKRLVVPRDGLVYELLTPDLQRSLEVFRIYIPPMFDKRANRITHIGEECIHLLSGKLTVYIADSVYDLEPGDTITYNPGMPHAVGNPSPTEPASVIAAVTPPSF